MLDQRLDLAVSMSDKLTKKLAIIHAPPRNDRMETSMMTML